jgi:hypothetical protein
MSVAQAPDDNLTDDAMQSEIELVSDLVVAATSSDGPMHQDDVDMLLGVHPVEAAGERQAGPDSESKV